MIIVGVDPGKTGAIASIGSDGSLLTVDDMPTVGKHVSVPMLVDIFQQVSEVGSMPICVIEDVSSSPQMGVTSSFSFGRSKGLVEMGAAMSDWTIVYVTPATWKRKMRLGKDKGAARESAMNQWPDSRSLFRRARDDGRAEAALIALWYLRHGCW